MRQFIRYQYFVLRSRVARLSLSLEDKLSTAVMNFGAKVYLGAERYRQNRGWYVSTYAPVEYQHRHSRKGRRSRGRARRK